MKKKKTGGERKEEQRRDGREKRRKNGERMEGKKKEKRGDGRMGKGREKEGKGKGKKERREIGEFVRELSHHPPTHTHASHQSSPCAAFRMQPLLEASSCAAAAGAGLEPRVSRSASRLHTRLHHFLTHAHLTGQNLPYSRSQWHWVARLLLHLLSDASSSSHFSSGPSSSSDHSSLAAMPQAHQRRLYERHCALLDELVRLDRVDPTADCSSGDEHSLDSCGGGGGGGSGLDDLEDDEADFFDCVD